MFAACSPRVRRVSTGVLALSSEAVRALEPALYAYARRAVDDKELAKDLVQETLLAAVQQPGRFEARSSLRTWLAPGSSAFFLTR